MSILDVVLIAGVIILFGLGMWHSLNLLAQQRYWNGGRCLLSGRPWYLIKMLDSGGRLYSDGGYESIVVTYKYIDGWGKK